VLRRVFRSKRGKVTREWKWLYDEELCDLYSSPNNFRVIESRRMRWAGHVTRMGKRRGAYRGLVGRPEGKRPLARPRRRWLIKAWGGACTGYIYHRTGTGSGMMCLGQ